MAELDTNVDVTTESKSVDVVEEKTADAPELARLKAELAKQKAALDKATKEAGDYRKQLRAKQSAEEVEAEEKRQAEEAMQAELNELRKRFAVAEASKKIMTFTGDEATANTVAAYLYGAEDVDGAIDAISKAWKARENKLRLEYGKIPAPGAGVTDGPSISRSQLDAMTYTDRVEFANKHPDEYAALMGRK